MIRKLVVLVSILLATLPGLAQEKPTSETILERALEAAGGREAFTDLVMIKIGYESRETAQDGRVRNTRVTGYVNTDALGGMRLEMPGDIVIVANGSSGWATMKGTQDPRPQTPKMAAGTNHLYLVPTLLPYAMTMDGVAVTGLREGKFDGKPVWILQVFFGPDFFMVPVMDTFWSVYISKEDYTVLAAGYIPPEAEKLDTEPVRYRYQKFQELGGVRLASQVLMEGLDSAGNPTSHNALIKVKIDQAPWDPTLFLSPEQIEALEEGDFSGPGQ